MNKFLLMFISTFVASFSTFMLISNGMNAVLASSGVTIAIIIVALLFKNNDLMSDTALCGSFAGMTSISLISFPHVPIMYSFAVISFSVGVVYTAAKVKSLCSKHGKYLFNGYGGRVGTFALTSVIFVLIPMGKFDTSIKFDGFNGVEDLLIILLSGISAYITVTFTTYLTKNFEPLSHNGKFLSPAIVGFVSYIVFGYIIGGEFSEYAFVVYAGSFAGMTATNVLSKNVIGIAGFLGGAYYILLDDILVGIGGKLGFVSFLAVITIITLLKVLKQNKKA